jgi:hypothetical protein
MTNRIGRLTFVIWFPFDAKGERHWGEADFCAGATNEGIGHEQRH